MVGAKETKQTPGAVVKPAAPEQSQSEVAAPVVAKVETQQAQVNNSDVLNHLKKLEAEAMAQAGKAGCNPFLWIKENIKPMREKFLATPSAEIAGKILTMETPVKANTQHRGPVLVEADPSTLEKNTLLAAQRAADKAM